MQISIFQFSAIPHLGGDAVQNTLRYSPLKHRRRGNAGFQDVYSFPLVEFTKQSRDCFTAASELRNTDLFIIIVHNNNRPYGSTDHLPIWNPCLHLEQNNTNNENSLVFKLEQKMFW